MATIAKAAGVGDAKKDESVIIRELSTDWLLIFDYADDPKSTWRKLFEIANMATSLSLAEILLFVFLQVEITKWRI